SLCARRAVRRRDLLIRSRLHEAASQHFSGRAPAGVRRAGARGDGRRQRAARYRRGAEPRHARHSGCAIWAFDWRTGRRPDHSIAPRAEGAFVTHPMIIRELTTLEECRQVATLEKDVWGYTDAEDVVPPPVLIVSVKRGGILLGAFDETGVMTGFVYSIPAVKNGRLTPWSHMLGVVSTARESGLGGR